MYFTKSLLLVSHFSVHGRLLGSCPYGQEQSSFQGHSVLKTNADPPPSPCRKDNKLKPKEKISVYVPFLSIFESWRSENTIYVSSIISPIQLLQPSINKLQVMILWINVWYESPRVKIQDRSNLYIQKIWNIIILKFKEEYFRRKTCNTSSTKEPVSVISCYSPM